MMLAYGSEQYLVNITVLLTAWTEAQQLSDISLQT